MVDVRARRLAELSQGGGDSLEVRYETRRSIILARGVNSIRLEADASMGTVAKRLCVAATTPAKLRLRDASDNAAGTAGDLKIAANLQRSVKLRIDVQHAIAHGK